MHEYMYMSIHTMRPRLYLLSMHEYMSVYIDVPTHLFLRIPSYSFLFLLDMTAGFGPKRQCQGGRGHQYRPHYSGHGYRCIECNGRI